MVTNELRKLIKSMLTPICENVYYENADDDNMYPHIVFLCSSIDLGDINRQDYMIDLDLWDKSESVSEIEEMADDVQTAFNAKNSPQSEILPTFYLVDRKSIPDEDKKIKHRLIRVLAQNYER